LTARWFDPREGRFGEPWNLAGGQWVNINAPDDHDWTLLLRG
jgi:hypothetical protein